AVELAAHLDRVGRPQKVLHEEVRLDECERDAARHDAVFRFAVLTAERERRRAMRADRRELHQMANADLLCCFDKASFPLYESLINRREQQAALEGGGGCRGFFGFVDGGGGELGPPVCETRPLAGF